MTDAQTVTITASNEGVRIESTGRAPIVGDGWTDACQIASQRSEVENPFALSRGSIAINGDILAPERGSVEPLEQFFPGSGLLEEEFEDSGQDFYGFNPLLPDITINGEEWGWFRPNDRWRLVPSGAGRSPDQVLRASACQELSMTSGCLVSEVAVLDNVVLSWSDASGILGDSEGNWFEVSYDASVDALAAAVQEVFARSWSEWEGVCPFCETGWSVEIEVALDPSLDQSVVADLLASVYDVCDEHATTDSTVFMGGWDWRYDQGSWLPIDEDPS